MDITTLYKIYLECTSVTTDSRNCPEGSLFIALKGDNFNGNAFAAKALESGSAYAVVDEAEHAPTGDSHYILVDNCLHTLQQLANYHRRQLGTRLIGITGTNGKTTTKELMAAVLLQKYNILYTLGNLNNHIGVPLTLLRLKPEHELGIIEMGASHPGDIKELVDIAEPDYGIITNVGKAHLEGFGSFEGMRPSFLIDGEIVTLGMSSIIEIVMLSAAAIILLVTKTDGIKATQGSVFPAGMQAVIAIFGIAWMGDTFLQGNMGQLTLSIQGIVQQMPWLFGVALFVMSILLYSQAATVRALVPLGIALGISPYMLIALFPAVNGYFFIPNYPTVVAAINFDRTGTTKIGKYVLNHSFMMPGLVSTVVAIALGLLFIQIF